MRSRSRASSCFGRFGGELPGAILKLNVKMGKHMLDRILEIITVLLFLVAAALLALTFIKNDDSYMTISLGVFIMAVVMNVLTQKFAQRKK